jgi:hypothetical protein
MSAEDALRLPAQYDMDVPTHPCIFDEAGNRAMYHFDGFQNHSCSPNSGSIFCDFGPTGGSYYQLALRNIEPGMPLLAPHCISCRN